MAKQKEKYLMGDTIPVDTEFWYANIKFRVVPRLRCEGCFFRELAENGKEKCTKKETEEFWCEGLDKEVTRFGFCKLLNRQDHTSVIFLEIGNIYD